MRRWIGKSVLFEDLFNLLNGFPAHPGHRSELQGFCLVKTTAGFGFAKNHKRAQKGYLWTPVNSL